MAKPTIPGQLGFFVNDTVSSEKWIHDGTDWVIFNLSPEQVVDTTWDDLVARVDRKTGDRFNVTTIHPLNNLIYHEIVLSSSNTFNYVLADGFTQIITII